MQLLEVGGRNGTGTRTPKQNKKTVKKIQTKTNQTPLTPTPSPPPKSQTTHVETTEEYKSANDLLVLKCN